MKKIKTHICGAILCCACVLFWLCTFKYTPCNKAAHALSCLHLCVLDGLEIPDIDKIHRLYYNKRMKHNQSSEDYLECILLLSRETEFVHRVDVARKIGVSQPAVQKAIKILEASGYVEFDGMHIYLTLKGEEYAQKVYERHCIIKEFLLLHGVNEIDADGDACEMEHVISETTFEMMKSFISERKN